MRLDVLLRTFADKAVGLRRALTAKNPHARAYAELTARAGREIAPGHQDVLDQGELAALDGLVKELEHAASVFEGESPKYPNEPIPNPDLRVRPSL